MTETQWRFLKAISDRVPDGRIVELRLFPAIRQGGSESGVAVVAVEELFVPTPAPAGSETDAPADSEAVNAFVSEGGPVAAEDIERARPAVTLDSAPNEFADVAVDVDATIAGRPGRSWSATSVADAEDAVVPADSPRSFATEFDLPSHGANPEADPIPGMAATASARTADREVSLIVDVEAPEPAAMEAEPTPTLDDILDLAASAELNASAAAAAPPARKRYAVLAARYRLTLKGPDRGQWDFEITHEADAPLETVDRVARGVAKRAGDEGEPEAFTAYQLRSTLSQPWWNATA